MFNLIVDVYDGMSVDFMSDNMYEIDGILCFKWADGRYSIVKNFVVIADVYNISTFDAKNKYYDNLKRMQFIENDILELIKKDIA